MPDADRLSADEARSLRRRGTVARSALVVTFAIDAGSMFALGHDEVLAVLVGAIPGVLLCFILFERYWRCPRCGESVWGERPDSDGDDGPGQAVFGRLVPDRCRSCGVRLAPSARTTAEVGTPGAGDPA